MKPHKVYILLALCVLFWSGNFVLGRFIKTDIDPIEMAFFRWFFVFLFILPSLFFLDLKKIIRIFKENIFIMLLLSILGISLYNTILYLALQTTTATNALLINSSTPMIIIVYSYFILKTQITKVQIIGVIISTMGVIYLVLKGNILNIFSIQLTQGDFWIIVCANIWALYSVLLRFKPKGLNNVEMFVSFVVIGLIFLTPVYLSQGYSLNQELSKIKEYWYFFVYVSLFTSILSYYFWHVGIDNIGAHETGQFTHLMPLFGSILAFIFLDENLNTYHLIGAVLIALGIYLSLFFKKSRVE